MLRSFKHSCNEMWADRKILHSQYLGNCFTCKYTQHLNQTCGKPNIEVNCWWKKKTENYCRIESYDFELRWNMMYLRLSSLQGISLKSYWHSKLTIWKAVITRNIGDNSSGMKRVGSYLHPFFLCSSHFENKLPSSEIITYSKLQKFNTLRRLVSSLACNMLASLDCP